MTLSQFSIKAFSAISREIYTKILTNNFRLRKGLDSTELLVRYKIRKKQETSMSEMLEVSFEQKTVLNSVYFWEILNMPMWQKREPRCSGFINHLIFFLFPVKSHPVKKSEKKQGGRRLQQKLCCPEKVEKKLLSFLCCVYTWMAGEGRRDNGWNAELLII